jgi:hypothetical protein
MAAVRALFEHDAELVQQDRARYDRRSLAGAYAQLLAAATEQG